MHAGKHATWTPSSYLGFLFRHSTGVHSLHPALALFRGKGRATPCYPNCSQGRKPTRNSEMTSLAKAAPLRPGFRGSAMLEERAPRSRQDGRMAHRGLLP